uniref:Uncharacterized protein n=1 Tax=Micrurus lemniscatus lemniscatus TaxID=129467 RepID=A0A2D4JF75_MICLE
MVNQWIDYGLDLITPFAEEIGQQSLHTVHYFNENDTATIACLHNRETHQNLLKNKFSGKEGFETQPEELKYFSLSSYRKGLFEVTQHYVSLLNDLLGLSYGSYDMGDQSKA